MENIVIVYSDKYYIFASETYMMQHGHFTNAIKVQGLTFIPLSDYILCEFDMRVIEDNKGNECISVYTPEPKDSFQSIFRFTARAIDITSKAFTALSKRGAKIFFIPNTDTIEVSWYSFVTVDKPTIDLEK